MCGMDVLGVGWYVCLCRCSTQVYFLAASVDIEHHERNRLGNARARGGCGEFCYRV